MPLIIKYIDEKEISLDRSMLFFSFFEQDCFDKSIMFNVIKFCKANEIGYEILGEVSCSSILEDGPLYLCVDVLMDEKNEKYQLLCKEYENEDGSMKYDNCVFCYSPRGFWQKKES